MNDEQRQRLKRMTEAARRLLEGELSDILEGVYNIRPDSAPENAPDDHLSPEQKLVREKIVDAVKHRLQGDVKWRDALASYVREAAFTMLNRFVALKMLEAREFVQQCVGGGVESFGFREFIGLAPGLAQDVDAAYRLYIESLFDEIGREVGALFDRRDPESLVWPRRPALMGLLNQLNDEALAEVWPLDETIGWVYQYFNSDAERRQMRESPAPRNSRELAVRNQFFTPRYVVEFLTDNTLGRLWHEMMQGQSVLSETEFFVSFEREVFLGPHDPIPDNRSNGADVNVRYVRHRKKKEPRDLKILDPACGSGHFLLYAFDQLITIYDEAWQDTDKVPRQADGRTLRDDYPTQEALYRDLPALILEHNLYGIDIDARAAQIAELALWMKAQRAYDELGVSKTERRKIAITNIVVAEPMPDDPVLIEALAERLKVPVLKRLFLDIVKAMRLAGEMGFLLRVREDLEDSIETFRGQWEAFWAERIGAKREQLQFTTMPPKAVQGELDLYRGVTGSEFFDNAKERILDALRQLAEQGNSASSTRRRLFAKDAQQGFAFIEVAGHRFDVILMNPPFGAGSTRAKKMFDKAYPRTKNDVYAAFVERGIELLEPRGFLGAITSRTGFFWPSFQKWREEFILGEAPPIVFADLGYDVLDDAMVEVAAYCLEKKP